MKFTPNKINLFLMVKLPLAYIAGVRMKSLTEKETRVTVRHRWISQNPYKSLYWAVQGMASELTTGVLLMKQITDSDTKISMLVTGLKGDFTKKAKGKITFTCLEGDKIKQSIEKTIKTGEWEKLTLTSEGFDEANEKVSKFEYEWSIRAKK
ncbi:MAG: thioesterase [Lutibacter sp.]|nr:MAG: thioesterase [Lutibacter sp.]